MMMLIPHVVVVGRALVPMVLVVVGFQLLIHVNGQPLKALVPNSDNSNVSDSDSNSNNNDDNRKVIVVVVNKVT